MQYVDRILRQSQVSKLDILVLPEMAFTGYLFPSAEAIAPYLEPTTSGVTTIWAQRVARQLRCTVVVGYPEKTSEIPLSRCYNSCVVVSEAGEVIANYRKSNLYFQDQCWADEGNGFFAGKIGSLGQVAIGICMDLNPYQFRASWNEFEFARHVAQNSARFVLMPLAWVTTQDVSEFSCQLSQPDQKTLDYWIRRFEPLNHRKSPGNVDLEAETIVVLANRCGREGDNLYAGTSCILGFHGNGEPFVYAITDRSSAGLLIADTSSSC
ncbi:carbon-nitrogen hydrolase [Aspergillus brasiliensis]|nr:carbon-nitrogen hydrolase [Aspergillus brasiliensis]